MGQQQQGEKEGSGGGSAAAAAGETSSAAEDESARFQAHQEDQWQEKFLELVDFKKDHEHCSVPNHWPHNPALAQWVKRQRYQYKLKMDGKRSSMIQDRQTALDQLGFVWDSHATVWEERLNDLIAFREIHGHCIVPTTFPENPQLAVWVKCQRRQFKIMYSTPQHQKIKSSMTMDRMRRLTMLGFDWDPRGKLSRKTSTKGAVGLWRRPSLL
jgi:hypothetical protein